ncbi:hypothetical protein BHE74_00008731 [Ensete ventricosum]|nr:hypothetical protein BHE74_00008731 [Ensete ventricosum]
MGLGDSRPPDPVSGEAGDVPQALRLREPLADKRWRRRKEGVRRNFGRQKASLQTSEEWWRLRVAVGGVAVGPSSWSFSVAATRPFRPPMGRRRSRRRPCASPSLNPMMSFLASQPSSYPRLPASAASGAVPTNADLSHSPCPPRQWLIVANDGQNVMLSVSSPQPSVAVAARS